MKQEIIEKLQNFTKDYLRVLEEEFEGLNLTRITSYDDFYSKQALDSVLPAMDSKLFSELFAEKNIIVDVGFGGGFPILPLALIYPNKGFIGIDAREKKVNAVRKIAYLLGIKNVAFFHLRIEDLLVDMDAVITFKAVGEISEFLPMIRFIEEKKIAAIFYKGPNVEEKERLYQGNCWELSERVDIKIPGQDGRTLLSYKCKNVPRGTSNKKLVKLSEMYLKSGLVKIIGG